VNRLRETAEPDQDDPKNGDCADELCTNFHRISQIKLIPILVDTRTDYSAMRIEGERLASSTGQIARAGV
jgi:hypothetical protein